MGVPNCVSRHLFVLLWESGCSPPIPIREAIFAGKSFSPSKMLAHDVGSNDPACCSLEGKLPISSGCVLLIKWHRLGDPPGREGWKIGREGGSIWTVAEFATCGSAAAPMNSGLTAPAAATACTRLAQKQTSQNTSRGGGGARELSHLSEELRSTNGWRRRKSPFSPVMWPPRDCLCSTAHRGITQWTEYFTKTRILKLKIQRWMSGVWGLANMGEIGGEYDQNTLLWIFQVIERTVFQCKEVGREKWSSDRPGIGREKMWGGGS